ncbi:uncharacterized protein Z519_05626 [Cladophialophora bantiana CBS 173.52]|uniref:Uncharacterized protein n=1 Tax=Cladophialophora bantiana (strain ATCC 10958 / CBS 173.52 / CDC B-1940 / NIH 8579) TaxID=1442370 RepID=A0A0D2HTX5_CLAB1|nr:uncharacterized protein Z519_05626 [Cladophialophora bantiana CBS 173.52]KIW94310.1 hypothetical protein Z519_05626 [Cladophialophora bantiana CBS 173.52]
MGHFQFHTLLLLKRDKCVNPNPDVDVCEKYTSQFLTTGVPLIISLCLFIILAIVLFIIVRRKRRQRHAQEAEKNRQIDDDSNDLELVVNSTSYPRDQAYKHFEANGGGGGGGGQQRYGQGQAPGMGVENPFETDVERRTGQDVASVRR